MVHTRGREIQVDCDPSFYRRVSAEGKGFMNRRNSCAVVSPALVTCMFWVAAAQTQHGTPPAETHLITPVQLVVAASTAASMGAVMDFHHNAITEAEYRSPPDTTPLHHEGVTFPST